MTRWPAAIASALCLGLAGCTQVPPAPVGLLEVSSRPAERALLAGIRAYDDANYESAERQLRQALAAGLAAPKDRAEAHKRLAFIQCAAARLVECEAEFRLARAADPAFALDRSEAGHPVWGAVYRRIAGP